ncbi:hypothetical protein BU25DRAFT_347015 [Macroventuria anomochaeta]|uniref:Uncharacterized protein n=1 Tax=Macroventuria anomochaeta TaxID=301207 RepID=A0ACB6RSB9_9PLEO|nr:uncharacterized protein BU25DRAFT_347015 [Macroventuria anomochaeta]KAF2624875.1 hypothetical protein BU25DRAFT_347015 [Macroventuria anomochaeta]
MLENNCSNYLEPAATSTPPSTSSPPNLSLAQCLTAEEASTPWAQRALSICSWVNDVSTRSPCIEPPVSSPSVDAQVLDTMSDSSRLRNMKMQRRSRSCSPTKKSSQYRNTVLKPANIIVDGDHDLPPNIEALLPEGLRDLLDRPQIAPLTNNHTHNEPADEHNGSRAWAAGSASEVNQLAVVYRDECRELARKTGSEPEYRTHLYGDVVEKLARIQPWRRTLSANCSDKLWLASLKPPNPTPILALPWPPLSANAHVSLESCQSSFDSNIIHVRPDSIPFNLTSPPVSTEPSEPSSASDVDGTITTPKPDITVGISREAFSRNHAPLLDYWQSHKVVLSDPHTTQGDMRFPFFIIEAKGLSTDGNLIGAQNQAAGGGTCAIRLLASLAAQDPENDAPRIVFSCTTEGAIHELWIHYQTTDEENIPLHHMACLGAWRTTLDRHASEFVSALAVIFSWGANVFFPQITRVLDRVLNAAISG